MTTFLKRYPLTTLVVCAICLLSLCKMPETELDDVPFIDKWTHLIMYGGLCSVIWFEYARHHRPVTLRPRLWLTVLFPLALSGLMEVLQEYCTETRSGDWMDMAANSVGVALGTALGYWVITPVVHRFTEK